MTGDDTPLEPPEREFDQSTAWLRMEEAVAEAIEGLPDFPGFYERSMLQTPCSHGGVVDEDYIGLELSYRFSDEDSLNMPVLHEPYRDLLREKWQEAGYEIVRDQERSADPVLYELEALRPDGMQYWFTAFHRVTLTVQSGCIKRAAVTEPCPAPLGGVVEDNAGRGRCKDSASEETTEAIAPFEGVPAALDRFSPNGFGVQAFESPGSYDGQL